MNCWVEVVVADAAARVTFAGDGPSGYPDPDFVAMPGVAYRVALLIGKTYVVSCDESVSIVERSSDEITVTSGADGLTIIWPVTYEIESFARSFSRNIRMLPPWIGGGLLWPIPNKYRRSGSADAGRFFCNTDQRFSVDFLGTSSCVKFGWHVSVTTNRNVTFSKGTNQ